MGQHKANNLRLRCHQEQSCKAAKLLIAERDDLHLRLRNGKSNGPLKVPQLRPNQSAIDKTISNRKVLMGGTPWIGHQGEVLPVGIAWVLSTFIWNLTCPGISPNDLVIARPCAETVAPNWMRENQKKTQNSCTNWDGTPRAMGGGKETTGKASQKIK